MITEKDSGKAKMKIKSSKEKEIVLSQDHEFNRKVLEYGKFKSLLFPNLETEKTRKLRFLDSGLDRVSAKAASKNKVSILYDLEKLRKLNKKDKAIELEKLIKNIGLCKKFKVNLEILNTKDEKDLSSLLESLGASSQQIKKAISF